MKAFIVACVLGAALAGDYYCEAAQDGDHSVRPRPEYDNLQQEHPFLQVRRSPVDASMKLGYETTTTSFGRFGFTNLTESAEPELVFAP